MSEHNPYPTPREITLIAAVLIGLAMMIFGVDDADIGNDKVSVTEPRVVIVLDPAQVTKVMDVIGCEVKHAD